MRRFTAKIFDEQGNVISEQVIGSYVQQDGNCNSILRVQMDLMIRVDARGDPVQERPTVREEYWVDLSNLEYQSRRIERYLPEAEKARLKLIIDSLMENTLNDPSVPSDIRNAIDQTGVEGYKAYREVWAREGSAGLQKLTVYWNRQADCALTWPLESDQVGDYEVQTMSALLANGWRRSRIKERA